MKKFIAAYNLLLATTQNNKIIIFYCAN